MAAELQLGASRSLGGLKLMRCTSSLTDQVLEGASLEQAAACVNAWILHAPSIPGERQRGTNYPRQNLYVQKPLFLTQRSQ